MLNNGRLGFIKYPLNLNYRVTFKGYDSWKDKDVPTRLYIAVYYNIITVTTLLSLISYNINSIYAFKTLFATVR